MEASGSVVIRSPEGIHLRVMRLIVEEAVKFHSDIVLVNGSEEFDARSMMTLMGMMASEGTEITIRAVGEDASGAVEALRELVNRECNKQATDACGWDEA